MAGRSGLSPTDMEASRLVFVSIRGAVPRRKVAVPVHEAATWSSFLQDVAAKLRIDGVAALYLAATGEVVDRLDTLQDIDELFAEPTGGRSGSGAGAGPAPASAFAVVHGVLDDHGESGSAKYEKRQSAARRALGRLFPSLLPAASSLPLTRQDVGNGGSNPRLARRRRSRAGGEEGGSSSRLGLLLAVILLGGLVVGAWWARSIGAGPSDLETVLAGGVARAGDAVNAAAHAAAGAVESVEVAAHAAVDGARHAAFGGGAAAPPPPPVLGGGGV